MILIGLDIGTTTIKAVAYDPEQGKIVAAAREQTPVTHPAPELSEHDPEALWQSVVGVFRQVMMQVRPEEVTALAVSSFGEAGLPLDRKGRALYPVIAWYDRRCLTQVKRWEEQLSPTDLHAACGQQVSTSLGVNKWLWIRDNVPAAAAEMAIWLSVPDYVRWRLTGEQATDYSIASRTSLLDQNRLVWSDTMMAYAGLSPAQLPAIHPSDTIVGGITEEAAEVTGLPAGTPCVLGGHDHLCAAVAAGALDPGIIVDSSGTAQALLMMLPEFMTSAALANGGFACYAHVVSGCYVLKGGLKAAGGIVAWLARILAGKDEEVTDAFYDELERSAAQGFGRHINPIWLPHLMGSGTPEGDLNSMAAIVGLRAEHDRGDLFRSLLESLAYWTRTNLEVMSTFVQQPVEHITLLGGTSRLRLLVQCKADVLGMPVVIPSVPHAAATGAALIAGVGAGIFPTLRDAFASFDYQPLIVSPHSSRVAVYDHLYTRIYRPLYTTLRDLHHSLADLQQAPVRHHKENVDINKTENNVESDPE